MQDPSITCVYIYIYNASRRSSVFSISTYLPIYLSTYLPIYVYASMTQLCHKDHPQVHQVHQGSQASSAARRSAPRRPPPRSTAAPAVSRWLDGFSGSVAGNAMGRLLKAFHVTKKWGQKDTYFDMAHQNLQMKLNGKNNGKMSSAIGAC